MWTVGRANLWFTCIVSSRLENEIPCPLFSPNNVTWVKKSLFWNKYDVKTGLMWIYLLKSHVTSANQRFWHIFWLDITCAPFVWIYSNSARFTLIFKRNFGFFCCIFHHIFRLGATFEEKQILRVSITFWLLLHVVLICIQRFYSRSGRVWKIYQWFCAHKKNLKT